MASTTRLLQRPHAISRSLRGRLPLGDGFQFCLFFHFATFRHFRQSTGCSDILFTSLPFSLNPFLNKRNSTLTMSIIPGPLLQLLHPSYRFFSEACASCTFWAPVNLVFFHGKTKLFCKTCTRCQALVAQAIFNKLRHCSKLMIGVHV